MRNPRPHQATEGPKLTPVESGSEHVFVPDQFEGGSLELLDYWRIVRRYRWSILGIVLIATIIGHLDLSSASSSVGEFQ